MSYDDDDTPRESQFKIVLVGDGSSGKVIESNQIPLKVTTTRIDTYETLLRNYPHNTMNISFTHLTLTCYHPDIDRAEVCAGSFRQSIPADNRP